MFAGSLLTRSLWTPKNLGNSLSLWFDASDASSLILENGFVSEWRDKSGNNKHAIQTTVSLRPQYLSSGFNGRPTLFFDALDDVFFVTNINANASGDFFIGASFNFITLAPWTMIAGFRDGINTAGDGQPILQRIQTTSAIGYHNTDVQITNRSITVNAVTGHKIATIGRNGGVNGNGGISTVTCTDAVNNDTVTGAQTWNSTFGTNFQIAGRQQPNFGPNFSEKHISEIIVCNRNLTQIELDKFRGYLAHKWWGNTNPLTSNHPFKNKPPRGL